MPGARPQAVPEQCLLGVLQLRLLVLHQSLNLPGGLVEGHGVIHQCAHHTLNALAVASLHAAKKTTQHSFAGRA